MYDNGVLDLNAQPPRIRQKIIELAQLIGEDQFGQDGVPIDTTFDQIEAIGHRAARLVAAEVDRQFVAEHQEHFDDPQPCSQCGQKCKSESSERHLKTRDGTMRMSEASCYCRTCRRTFFPATH